MRVAFNDLPAVIRERFIRIASNPKPPEALVCSSHGYYTWLAPLMAVLALGGLVATMSFHYDEALMKAPYFDREVYLATAGILFVFFASVLGTCYRLVWKNPPYRRGAYLFPSYLVIVHGADLDIVPLSNVAKPTLVTRYRNGVYVGSRIDLQETGGPRGATASFYYSTEAPAKAALDAFFSARGRMQQVLASRDANTLMQIDPFYECTISGQWIEPPAVMKAGPLVDRVPAAASWARWLGSLVVALGLTFGIYTAMVVVCDGSRRAQEYCSDSRARGEPCCF